MSIDYEKLSDNEIIELIAEKDDDAMQFMMKKYGGIVKKEVRTVYLIGAETDDLIQEGMIGLFKAIRDYSPDKGAAFSTFATLCIRRQIKTAINTSNRDKHKPLNTYISIYANSDETESDITGDMGLGDSDMNPEAVIIAKEQKSYMEQKIEKELSSLEKKVLRYYLEGIPYSEIAEKIGKKEKSVDNALQRIRAKLSNQ